MDLAAMPMPMEWDPEPGVFDSDGQAMLSISAGPVTDIFVDPGGDAPTFGAPKLLGTPPDVDFQLSAKVTVGFRSTYDAGVLVLWIDAGRWAKLCFELSPQGDPTAVSVVTRGQSDDANGFAVTLGDPLWLRVSRLGPAWAFHASTDGRYWQLVRYFSLDSGDEPVRVGFEAQSPTGEGCTALFEEIRFLEGRLADLRGGI